nr:hypothetical protein [Nocardia tengchongensis]
MSRWPITWPRPAVLGGHRLRGPLGAAVVHRWRHGRAHPEFSGGLRISEVDYHVAVDRVATPIIAIGVPAGEAAAVASVKSAAAQMESTDTFDARSAQVKNLVATRLRAGCACVVGVVLYGPPAELRTLAAQPGIRAVEALPADASAAVFAVSPLLPEQREAAVPGPDDGPVPAG